MPTPGGVPQTSGPTGTSPPPADSATASEQPRQLALTAVPATRLTAAHPMTMSTAVAGTAVARLPRRAAWPTLTLTLLALLAVVGVLLLTGGGGGTTARFGVRARPAAISLTAGDSAPIVLTLSAEHGFDTTVTLDTTALPPGVEVKLDRRSVPVSAGQPPVTVTGQVRTSSTVATSTIGIEVIGRAGKATDSSLIELHIQPAGITDSASPPVVDRASFTVSGAVHGALRPGGSLPIDVRLMNANPFELDIDNLTVAVAGTSKPACPAGNFVVLPYRGGYPVRVPAGSTSTLASLRVPASRWPQLRMRATAPRAACLGATARLRYAGTGSSS
jgi:hypothetical protein